MAFIYFISATDVLISHDFSLVNVSLLLKGNTTNKANNNNSIFIDSSTNNAIVTANGTAQGTISPFSSGGSVYLNGSGTSYLSLPFISGFTFPSDFTIEAWFNVSDAGRTADTNKIGTIVGCGTPTTVANYWSIDLTITAGVVNRFRFFIDGSTALISVTGLTLAAEFPVQ